MTTAEEKSLDFIRIRITDDVKAGRNGGAVVTRFPPEPNGYLHIGHAKAICINFEIASDFGGRCHLRFDDTNPIKEEMEYVHGIQDDLRWLGYDWGDHLYFASDYYERLYECAEKLIEKGSAYVCSLNAEEVRAYRGTLKEPGRPSPDRDRPVEENLDLFRRMRAGEFEDGKYTLRAKIDMASGNINLRDPAIYRIRRAHHHRTGDAWCIYPMYDFAHGLSDAFEGITHSLCSLEFENHRPLYDWFLDELEMECHPQQIEFARLNMSYTVMSKRMLRSLVDDGHVTGWEDPRMPTLSAMRRRGYPPAAIRHFCDRIGIAKRDNLIDIGLLEHSVRDELNRVAPRFMAVLDPIKVVITNFPDGETDELDAVNNPEDPSAGTRKVPFSRELYIERADFMEAPPRKFFRLGPGREVRLRWAYFITCNEVIKDDRGEIVELRCSYDPATRGGDAPDGRKVKGTLHWVSAPHALEAEVRLYDRLFATEDMRTIGDDWLEHVNPDSLEIRGGCRIEPCLGETKDGDRVQFERIGYFCKDPDSTPDRPVFNRTVTLRDAWAKKAKTT